MALSSYFTAVSGTCAGREGRAGRAGAGGEVGGCAGWAASSASLDQRFTSPFGVANDARKTTPVHV